MRRLHDLCASSDALPSSLWLSNVETTRDVIAAGGQAILHHGSFNGRHVAVRQLLLPQGQVWGSLEGLRIQQVWPSDQVFIRRNSPAIT